MPKQFQLKVPEPCHENWGNMTQAEKGKFCGSCQKVVMDFTRMSDEQLIAFFKKPSTGSVCGRFQSDQLNRDFTVPRKRIPWIKYFFQFALPAFLFSLKASGQKKPGNVKESIKVSSDFNRKYVTMGMVLPRYSEKLVQGKVIDIASRQPLQNAVLEFIYKSGRNGKVSITENGQFSIRMSLDNSKPETVKFSMNGYQSLSMPYSEFVTKATSPDIEFPLRSVKTIEDDLILMGDVSFTPSEVKVIKQPETISGKVTDENGNPVSYASVLVKGTKNGTVTDESGNFKLTAPKDNNASILVASALGFDSKETEINSGKSSDNILIRLPVSCNQMMGELVIVTKPKKKKTIPVIPEKTKDIPFSNFRVYPNPVKTTEAINIDWNKMKPGDYSVSLVSQSGQTIKTENFSFVPANNRPSFSIPETTAAGSYFIRISNKQSGKVYTEKIIVE